MRPICLACYFNSIFATNSDTPVEVILDFSELDTLELSQEPQADRAGIFISFRDVCYLF